MVTPIRKKRSTTVMRIPNELVHEIKIRIASYRLECEKQKLEQLTQSQVQPGREKVQSAA